MRTMKALANLRLRVNPGLGSDTYGEIQEGSICYAFDGKVSLDGITWQNIVAPTLSGCWFDGWAATAYEGTELLAWFSPETRILCPVDGEFLITQLFAENPHIYGALGLLGHNGLDFGTPPGVPVLAPAHGVVVHARKDPSGYGNYVRVDHPWGITLSAHLDRIFATEGASVRAGHVLGLTGNTGMSTGPHLHFEMRTYPVRENGYGGRVDPLAYIETKKLSIMEYAPEKLRTGIKHD